MSVQQRCIQTQYRAMNCESRSQLLTGTMPTLRKQQCRSKSALGVLIEDACNKHATKKGGVSHRRQTQNVLHFVLHHQQVTYPLKTSMNAHARVASIAEALPQAESFLKNAANGHVLLTLVIDPVPAADNAVRH